MNPIKRHPTTSPNPIEPVLFRLPRRYVQPLPEHQSQGRQGGEGVQCHRS